ncbi:toxin-activating lysine-acyltransferase [Roseovarius spongiae]|uniref:RTX toxin-activating lysine-acyltransferase n=1 Tax=Roseovarius spongiae TaxID=2320272 RepID=A0A3A8AWQ1_9RHOB|nr:toxin-activating lysine-acyltransferase [Roseovarius spongiae]RKF16828.1 toxin-activating lysine-acyltransferase [Roseovarius spongiae]
MENKQSAQSDLAGMTDARVARHREGIRAGLAEILPLLMLVKRYRHLSLADMEWLVVSPMLQNRIALARLTSEEEGARPALRGFAFWASLDAEAEAKVKEQIAAQVFPIRLRADEWRSGERVWLLDVVAETREIATQLFIKFGRSPEVNGPFSSHPIISKLVDNDVLGDVQISEPTKGAG